MISFDEALSLVETVEVYPVKERIGILESLGSILASKVYADIDMPPFDKSAVDGYACRRADLPGPLKVIEIISAGASPLARVLPGQCSKIMTGAIVPEGADCVLMVEHTMVQDDGLVVFTRPTTSNNIAYQAEDVHKGQLVLNEGIIIMPQHIAMLAAVGCVNPEVYRKPVIGVIITGDELVEPDTVPVGGQIRNSNAYQLMAQVKQTGLEVIYTGIAPDNKEDTRNIIDKTLKQVDVLLLTGGVSMGDFDFVPTVLEELGIQIGFRSVAVQPGKPTLFGYKSEKFIFGLPGNPVSSFVQFEVLVKPLIYRIMGTVYCPKIVKLPMLTGYTRKNMDRKSFIPVRYALGMIEPIEYHGSAHIHAFEKAWGIMALNPGENNVKPGELRDVRQI